MPMPVDDQAYGNDRTRTSNEVKNGNPARPQSDNGEVVAGSAALTSRSEWARLQQPGAFRGATSPSQNQLEVYVSTIPPIAPVPDEIPEERPDDQQPDPFGEKTDDEGGDPENETISESPSDDPRRPSNPA